MQDDKTVPAASNVKVEVTNDAKLSHAGSIVGGAAMFKPPSMVASRESSVTQISEGTPPASGAADQDERQNSENNINNSASARRSVDLVSAEAKHRATNPAAVLNSGDSRVHNPALRNLPDAGKSDEDCCYCSCCH